METLKQLRQRADWLIASVTNSIEQLGGDVAADPDTSSPIHHARIIRDELDARIDEAPEESVEEQPTEDPVEEPDPEPTPTPPSGGFLDDFSGGLSGPQNGYEWGTVINGSVEGGELLLTHSAKPATSDREGDSVAQATLKMPPGITEAWVEYVPQIPDNYRHRTIPGDSDNNKFFQIWAGVRNDIDAGIIAELDLPSEEGSAGRVTMHRNEIAPDEPGKRAPVRFRRRGAIIVRPGERQRWRWHVRVGTPGHEHSDGTLRVWIDDEEIPLELWDGSILDPEAVPIRPFRGGSRELRRLRLLGWSNSGYDEDTTFAFEHLQVHVEDPGW